MYNSDITIQYNEIYDINTALLYFTNGSDGHNSISHNEMHGGGDTGIEMYSYSDPSFDHNEIYDTDGDTFYGSSNCVFSLGTSPSSGSNSITNSGEMDINTDYNSTIYAKYNWWGSSSPNPWVSNNVIWAPYLTSAPMLKIIADADENPSVQDENTVNQDKVGMPEVDIAALLYHEGKCDEAAV